MSTVPTVVSPPTWPFTAQVTDVFCAFVTVAVSATVPLPASMLADSGVTLIATAGGAELDSLLPPPQAASAMAISSMAKRCHAQPVHPGRVATRHCTFVVRIGRPSLGPIMRPGEIHNREERQLDSIRVRW